MIIDETGTPASRTKALRDLVELRSPVAEAASALESFPWDSPHELVSLTKLDVVSVVRRFLAGEISKKELQSWAEAIEGRDDIRFDERAKEAIFELATPELAGSPDNTIPDLLGRLEGSTST